MSLLSYDYDSRVLAYSRSAHGAPDEDNHLLFWDNYLIGRRARAVHESSVQHELQFNM